MVSIWRPMVLVALGIACVFATKGLQSRAEESISKSKLLSAQIQLLELYLQAMRAVDFETQIEIFERLRSITEKNHHDQRVVSTEEIDFALQDLRRIDGFSDEQRNLAKQQQIEEVRGYDSTQIHDYTEAIRHLKKSLELSNSIFGESSFHSHSVRVSLATAILNSQGKGVLQEGVNMSREVRLDLEKRELTDSSQYRDAMITLTGLYLEQKDDANAIESGDISVRLLEQAGVTYSSQYSDLTGVLAKVLNQKGQYKKSLHFARLGLNTNPPSQGPNVRFYLRLLQEYARAKVAINDFEKVPEAYEELLSVSDRLPGYPAKLRLEFLDEYLSVLEKLGRNERRDQVADEISRLKLSVSRSKSRYSD